MRLFLWRLYAAIGGIDVVAELLAGGLISYGIWLFSAPAGFVVGGILLYAITWFEGQVAASQSGAR